MIAVLDYGVGNLFSLCSSLRAIGADAVVTDDPDTIKKADRLILPGVGAFADAARKLRESGLDLVIKEEVAAGKPIMGICLGMQLLFERSHEYGIHQGLGLLKGEILPFSQILDPAYKIPHIGWNALRVEKDAPLFRYIKDGDHVYFVHSFYASEGLTSTAATTEYGIRFTASVAEGNVFGCQFHPEKSGNVGLAILKGFCEAGGATC